MDPQEPTSNIVLLRPRSQTPQPQVPPAAEDDAFPDVEEYEVEKEEPRQAQARRLTLVPSVPEIRVDREFHVVLGLAMKALANDALLFSKGDQLVRVVGEGAESRLMPMSSANIRERLSLHARWVRDDELVHPPAAVASAIVRRGEWDHLRALRAMTTFPVLSSDGALRTTEGYDPTTRTFYVGGCPVDVPEEPTIDQAKAACGVLLDLVADFPFVGEAHKSAWLAALLTPLSRYMHDGNVETIVGKRGVSIALGAIVEGSGRRYASRRSARAQAGADGEVLGDVGAFSASGDLLIAAA